MKEQDWINEAEKYFNVGNYIKAIENYNKAIELDPNNKGFKC